MLYAGYNIYPYKDNKLKCYIVCYEDFSFLMHIENNGSKIVAKCSAQPSRERNYTEVGTRNGYLVKIIKNYCANIMKDIKKNKIGGLNE